MDNRIYEIYMLNPKLSMISRIRNKITRCDFEELKSDEKKRIWKYKKGNKSIYFAINEDFIGPYIIILCDGISNESLRKAMSNCPECGADNLQVSILYSWENAITQQLNSSGKLNYIHGAYDRHGTLPETHKCLECGCKWHNSASMYYWNDIVKNGGLLTEMELGLSK